jgi:hypothetical protein
MGKKRAEGSDHMQRIQRIVLIAAISLLASSAQADLIFSNVSIQGSLAGGASFNTGPNYIDFIFPDAFVGDVSPARDGNIVITYDAQSVSGPMTEMLVSVLGALSGSGMIFFNEVVEDIHDPNNIINIASYSATFDDTHPLPGISPPIVFVPASDKIRVKKTFVLSAPDTQAFDMANISLVQQSIHVPEPMTIASLVLAVAVAALRRR